MEGDVSDVFSALAFFEDLEDKKGSGDEDVSYWGRNEEELLSDPGAGDGSLCAKKS